MHFFVTGQIVALGPAPLARPLLKDEQPLLKKKKEKTMLSWAVMFLIIALIAGVLGFTGVAGISADIAWILFVIFIIAFILASLWVAAGP